MLRSSVLPGSLQFGCHDVMVTTELMSSYRATGYRKQHDVKDANVRPLMSL